MATHYEQVHKEGKEETSKLLNTSHIANTPLLNEVIPSGQAPKRQRTLASSCDRKFTPAEQGSAERGQAFAGL